MEDQTHFDGEYGCEELTEGQQPKVSVTLINEKEEETCFLWRTAG